MAACGTTRYVFPSNVISTAAAGVCFPRLVVHAGGLGHRGARAAGDDPPALHLPAFDGGWR